MLCRQSARARADRRSARLRRSAPCRRRRRRVGSIRDGSGDGDALGTTADAAGVADAAGTAGTAGAAGADSGIASPTSPTQAQTVLTGTDSPAWTRILSRTPSSNASTSITDLSVSISNRTSPRRTGSPSFLCHSTTDALFGHLARLRHEDRVSHVVRPSRLSGTSQALEQCRGRAVDVVGIREERRLEGLGLWRDAGLCADPRHRRVEGVEDLEPGCGRRSR